MRKLISSEYNEVTGFTTSYYSVEGGKKIVVQVTQDVEPILENNKKILNSISSKSRQFGREGLGTKVASIPNGVVEQMRKERGINLLTCTEKEMKAFLNNSEFKHFRTAHGRI